MSGWRARSGGECQPLGALGYSETSHPADPLVRYLLVQLEHRAQEASDDGEGQRVGDSDGRPGGSTAVMTNSNGLGPIQRNVCFVFAQAGSIDSYRKIVRRKTR
jgi:hypothetical protein